MSTFKILFFSSLSISRLCDYGTIESTQRHSCHEENLRDPLINSSVQHTASVWHFLSELVIRRDTRCRGRTTYLTFRRKEEEDINVCVLPTVQQIKCHSTPEKIIDWNYATVLLSNWIKVIWFLFGEPNRNLNTFFSPTKSSEYIWDFHINGFLLSPDLFLFILQPRDEFFLHLCLIGFPI